MMKKLLLALFAVCLLNAAPINLTFDGNYHYDKNLIKKQTTIPTNDLIGMVEGYEIHRAKYKNFDALKLYYKEGDEKMRKTVEGKYWQVEQKPVPFVKDKTVQKQMMQDLIQSYKDALQAKGATIYPSTTNKDIAFVFQKNSTWGIFTSYNSGCKLSMVEMDTFKQTLVINPDELLAELQKSGEVKLEGIYFDTNKATLKPASRTAILAATALMKKYPTLMLEVQGHTDSVGSDEANLVLSDKRAASVREAMLSEGIKADRLTSKGFGEKAPITTNDTDEGRALNRRVILKRIRGGEEKALITIDFMKPIPGFEKESTKSYADEKLHMRINQNGKKENKNINGDMVKADYSIIDKQDKSVSYTEILKNYEGVLESFGAEIIGKGFSGDQSIYFHIANRGDGKEIYGKVVAYNSGAYSITFMTP